MWLIVFPFLFLLYVGHSFPPLLYVILLHFPHDRSIILQHISKYPRCYWSNSEAPNFQYHTKLCSNFSTLLLSSLNLSLIFWWISLLFVECCFYHGNPGFNFTCRLQLASCYPNILKIPHSPVVLNPVDKGEKFERRQCVRTWSWPLIFIQ
jgi:hypothetical protein